MHKIMALDIGTKRIGIAISDYLHVLANRHSYISRTPEASAIEQIKKIAKDNNVQEIVIGVPYNMDGTQGGQAQDCIDFSKNFEQDFEIHQEDERLTSDTAEENLKQQKVNFRKEKGLVDVESARIIFIKNKLKEGYKMAEKRIIETVDENGNNIKFELFDIIVFEDQEYALLTNPEVEDDENIVVMKLLNDGDGYTLETIEDDDEFDRVQEYIESIEDETED